jgi:hypothetical protein
VVPKDEASGYKPVQKELVRLRREGLLDWSFIADNTRWMRKAMTWRSVEEAIAVWSQSYRRDLWQGQGVRIEVWLEKDALAGVVMEQAEKWGVPLMVTRGTSSITFLYSAAMEARGAWENVGVRTVVLALYDYDMGGVRSSGAVERGLREHAGDAPIEYRQLAVMREQIEEWSLPTRPAKKTDSEYARWVREYGTEAVELDAIPPNRLLGLVEEAVLNYVDKWEWEMEQLVEEEEREGLAKLLRRGGG